MHSKYLNIYKVYYDRPIQPNVKYFCILYCDVKCIYIHAKKEKTPFITSIYGNGVNFHLYKN